MKITKQQLKKIIKEEIENTRLENVLFDYFGNFSKLLVNLRKESQLLSLDLLKSDLKNLWNIEQQKQIAQFFKDSDEKIRDIEQKRNNLRQNLLSKK